MMKITIKYSTLVVVLGILFFSSCKKDKYLSGGSVLDPHVNMTTYDYLKTNPLFDTLVQLIDKAGLKDQVNGDITFFAPTDYSINQLMLRRTDSVQIINNDESIKYTIDSFPVAELRDSLKAYMFQGEIKREGLTHDNKIFKNLLGEEFSIKLLKSIDYTDYVGTAPDYLFLVRIKNGLDPDDNVEPENRDNGQLIQTSGILTTSGVLHVINNRHVFYWE